jgi:hypothetical protein
MKTIAFNTGRKYTAEGQFIKATLHDDGVVTFFDHSRGIDGEFKLCGSRFDQQIVMDAYDHNIAKNTSRSWADGMLRGGCNTR